MGEPSQDAGSQSTLEVLRESLYNDSTLITERLGYSLQPFDVVIGIFYHQQPFIANLV